MCHFELEARELGLNGDWQVVDRRIPGREMEYIVSWLGSFAL